MSNTPTISVRNLGAAYNRNLVLSNINFEIKPGTLTAIIGPNGAGKSTLLKSMLELQPRLSGEVVMLGKPYNQAKKQIGYVPQRGSVDWDFPTNVLDVVTMGLYGKLGWLKWPSKNERKIAMQAISRMGMEQYRDRQISQLSGGQQQRVFLARALVQNAEIYFLDEPLAGVDAATEKIIMDTLQQLAAQGKTVMVVHHDLQTVEQYFDHVLLLNKSVIAHGAVAETFTNEKLVKTYGGTLRFLKERDLDAIVIS